MRSKVLGMTRCIFRKPKRQFRFSQWLAVTMVMLGAALCLELQAGLSTDQETGETSPLVGQLHHP